MTLSGISEHFSKGKPNSRGKEQGSPAKCEVSFPLQPPYSLPGIKSTFTTEGKGEGTSPARQTLTPDTLVWTGRKHRCLRKLLLPWDTNPLHQGKGEGIKWVGESKKSTALEKIAGMWIPHSRTKLKFWKTVQKSERTWSSCLYLVHWEIKSAYC